MPMLATKLRGSIPSAKRDAQAARMAMGTSSTDSLAFDRFLQKAKPEGDEYPSGFARIEPLLGALKRLHILAKPLHSTA